MALDEHSLPIRSSAQTMRLITLGISHAPVSAVLHEAQFKLLVEDGIAFPGVADRRLHAQLAIRAGTSRQSHKNGCVTRGERPGVLAAAGC